MTPTILITRPDPAGPAFADKVRARLGCSVPILLSPLMKIEMVGRLPDLSGVGTLVFTSRNAVEAYVTQGGRRDISAYAVGDATAEKAKGLGFDVRSCRGDADALVARLISDNVSGPCLHVRGKHVTGDIANRLNLAGIETHEAVIYQQDSVSLNAAAVALLGRESPVILPLFSPRTARLFFDNVQIRAPLYVAAISSKVADCVPGDAVKALKTGSRPDAQAVLDLLPGLLEAGKQLEGGNRAQ